MIDRDALAILNLSSIDSNKDNYILFPRTLRDETYLISIIKSAP